jgi:hypothetical protein
MGLLLRPFYRPGVTLLRAEFGKFRLSGPGPACAGAADLRRWVVRCHTVADDALAHLLDDGAGVSPALEGA